MRYNRQWKIKASFKLWEQCMEFTEADENPSPTAPDALRQWPQRPIWSECSLPGCYTVISRRAWVRVCCFGRTNTQLDNNRPSATECNHTLARQHNASVLAVVCSFKLTALIWPKSPSTQLMAALITTAGSIWIMLFFFQRRETTAVKIQPDKNGM